MQVALGRCEIAAMATIRTRAGGRESWPRLLLFLGVAVVALLAVVVVALNILTAPSPPSGSPMVPPTTGPSSPASSPTPQSTPTPPTTPSPVPPVCSYGPIGQFLCVTPSIAAAGSAVTVSGYSPDCASVTLISAALASPDEFAGLPAVSVPAPGGRFSAVVTISADTAPANYPVTARACGGNLGVEVALTIG